MNFHVSPEAILGSKIRIKILKHLFTLDAPMSEGELAKIIKTSHMTINRLMKELQAINLTSCKRAGNVYIWKVNKRSYFYKILSPIIKRIAVLPLPLDHLRSLILEYLPKKLTQKIVLFGSISRGEEKPGSDIDLYIQIRRDDDIKRLQKYIGPLSDSCLDLYGNRLAAYILTEIESRDKKRKSLFSEINKGIMIYP